MALGLELHGVLPDLEDLDARPERDHRAGEIVDVRDLGLLVVDVAARVAGLAGHRIRDRGTFARESERERDDDDGRTRHRLPPLARAPLPTSFPCFNEAIRVCAHATLP